ncbi:MAG: hypothetical protein ACU0BK_13920 [Shimia sp.]|uniref:hypothetical protein n=1 Tax=Shimia sp. TaxID=1954381 RepID=UPI004057DA4D
MKRITFLAVAAVAAAGAPAMAQTWSSNAPKLAPVNQPEGMLVHPFPSGANHCPTGLQPITMGGVICCGTPTTSEAYVNRSGGKRRSYAPMSCPPGQKGCG